MKKRPTERGIVYCVTGCHWKQNVTVEKDFGTEDDMLVEAGTRAVEIQSKKENFNIGLIVQIYKKDDEKHLDKHWWVNSYTLLNNAALYELAERVRHSVKKTYGIDLAVKQNHEIIQALEKYIDEHTEDEDGTEEED